MTSSPKTGIAHEAEFDSLLSVLYVAIAIISLAFRCAIPWLALLPIVMYHVIGVQRCQGAIAAVVEVVKVLPSERVL